jgi:hypothetical protein
LTIDAREQRLEGEGSDEVKNTDISIDPARADLNAKLLEQIEPSEFLPMCIAFIRRTMNDTAEPGNPPKNTIDEVIVKHGSREVALERLEKFLEFYNRDDLRTFFIDALREEFYETKVDIHGAIESSMGWFLRTIQRMIEGERTKPFDMLQSECSATVAMPDSPDRRTRRLDLEEQLATVLSQHVITRRDYDQNDIPWTFNRKNLSDASFLDLQAMIAGKQQHISLVQVRCITEMLENMRYEEMLNDTIIPVDHERVRQETLLYGAKTANLREMQRIITPLKKILARNFYRLNIPRFEGIPASLYNVWKRGENIDGELQKYYAWIGGKAVYIRSSAVFSEDNAGATGAGIYHSEKLTEHASYDEFKAAVIRVYESTDAERALQYRQQIGVPHESMGITIQDSADPFDDPDQNEKKWNYWMKGYMNTSRAYAPALMDVNGENRGARPIFVKKGIFDCLASGEREGDANMNFYPVDFTKCDATYLHVQERVGFFGYLLERAYGVPVQCEFVAEANVMYIVQTRILPPAHRMTANVVFPDEKPLLVREATGVIDEELDILPHDESNGEKHGLVIFEQSYFASVTSPEKFFPKSGAVVILFGARRMAAT